MPISHETLLLAKKYAEQLHAGGGTHYTGGHGIIVEGEAIKVDVDVVAQQSDIQEINKTLETTNSDLNNTKTTLSQTQQELSTTKQDLSTFKTTINQNITNLNNKDTELQQQIDNIKTGETQLPIATAGTLGIVMPRQGLSIDRSGALNTTIQEYGDLGSGVVFLDHGQSKVLKFYYPCNSVYLEFHLVDTTSIAGSNLLYMNTSGTLTITRGSLTASLNPDGLSITLTNSHGTNTMFILYGCADIISK